MDLAEKTTAGASFFIIVPRGPNGRRMSRGNKYHPGPPGAAAMPPIFSSQDCSAFIQGNLDFLYQTITCPELGSPKIDSRKLLLATWPPGAPPGWESGIPPWDIPLKVFLENIAGKVIT
jgi:hypothetical protein